MSDVKKGDRVRYTLHGREYTGIVLETIVWPAPLTEARALINADSEGAVGTRRALFGFVQHNVAIQKLTILPPDYAPLLQPGPLSKVGAAEVLRVHLEITREEHPGFVVLIEALELAIATLDQKKKRGRK
jgi:hypothetical protein